MRGVEVHTVLRAIGAARLYHANSVLTSSTFLEQGGLLSRGFVEVNRLEQTPQQSDQTDKKYGVWNRIFVDHVDIHERARRANEYGPVLFVFSLDILCHFPSDWDVLATKVNPIYWQPKQSDNDRYFEAPEELAERIHFGDFEKMLVIASEKLEFPMREAEIILDDPQRELSSGESAYTTAEQRLTAAAAKGKVKISIQKRQCGRCGCNACYEDWSAQRIDECFG